MPLDDRGDGVAWRPRDFAPASVFVLLSHLALMHQLEIDYLARLSKASLALGVATKFGAIDRGNIVEPALAATTTGWFGGVEQPRTE